jgi:glycine/D-amino acid oxidase-like deaminating enzyme
LSSHDGLRSTQAKQGQDRHDHHDKPDEIDDLVHLMPLFKKLWGQRSNANEVPLSEVGNQNRKVFVHLIEMEMKAEGELDLRGGRSLWDALNGHPHLPSRLEENLRSRIIIIGSGITGSFLAERLSRMTSSIIVVDRHQPQSASTAASTSLLQWELDAPLRELSASLGPSRATQIYRASALAVREIITLTGGLGIACHCTVRPSLLIAGNRMGPHELLDEQRQREKAGLPTVYVPAAEIERSFGFNAEAALYSEGAAEANPVALAQGLMATAIKRGIRLFHPETVVDYDLGGRQPAVLTESGHELSADILILANGYEMPDFVPSRIHRVLSTWALATERGTQAWPRHALVWEAASPYLYARQNSEGRVILGGEDEELLDARLRDDMIGMKADIIRRKFNQLYDAFKGETEFAWAGFFGVTDDSLPLIGPLPGRRNVFAAFGYGGNGITFSAMAAHLIAGAISGRSDPLLENFAVDRA